MAQERTIRLMDDVGDGSGVTNFIADYSGGALVLVKLDMLVAFRVHRVFMIIVDEDAVNAWDADRYSASMAALGRWVGWAVAKPSGTPTFQLTPEGIPKTQGDFRRSGWERTRNAFAGGVNREMVTFEFNTWTEVRGVRQPLRVAANRMLQVFLNNDFTSVARHQFLAEISIE